MRVWIAPLGAALAAWTLNAGACAQPMPLAPQGVRELAITIDDAPRGDSEIMTAGERTRLLLAGLAEAGVEEAAFFAIAGNISRSGEARLRAYAEAGHVIANHSNTHPHLHRVSAEDYLADIAAADARLRALPGFRPWFRFPYLAEGETEQKRDAVRAGLRALGYAQGYVTVDNFDWSLDRIFNQATARGRDIDRDALRDLYVETIADAADFYDQVAVTHLGRSPRHILLLHENDLAALYFVDLAAELRRRGWRIIRASEAYDDPIARDEPDTLFLGQGRVSALALAAGGEWRDLVGPRENEDELAELFFTRVVRRP